MSDEQEPVRIRSNAELCQMITEIEGQAPDESLVVMLIRQGRLRLFARRDLAGCQAPGAVEEALDTFLERVSEADVRFVVYTKDHLAGWDMLGRCASHLPHGTRSGALLVDGGTWHEADGRHGSVDPNQSRSISSENGGLRGLAGADPVDGLDTAFETPELAARLLPVLDGLPEADDEAAISARMGGLIRRNLPVVTPGPQESGVAAEDAFTMAMLTHHQIGRHVALLAITPSNAGQHLQMWRAVVAEIPAVVSEMPLFIAGVAAWVSGDRGTASSALARSIAAAAKGGPRPSLLLAELVDRNVPQAEWGPLRARVLSRADPAVQAAVATLSTRPTWETVNQHLLRPRPDPPQRPPAPRIPR
ncbi:MAG: DUF4192 domain-containing protein [Actinobacteria bacterium]|nr:DUF4192 domain-containing protein [Actinomycetota bacterium]